MHGGTSFPATWAEQNRREDFKLHFKQTRCGAIAVGRKQKETQGVLRGLLRPPKPKASLRQL